MRVVLNALWHQRFKQLEPQQHLILVLIVLNALQHQRFKQYLCSTTWVLAAKCSTPYSIKGLNSFGRNQQQEQNIKCSTPYSIKGLNSIEVHLHSFPDLVLNALQHQRFKQFSAPGRLITQIPHFN